MGGGGLARGVRRWVRSAARRWGKVLVAAERALVESQGRFLICRGSLQNPG